jgi:hypothetical protein
MEKGTSFDPEAGIGPTKLPKGETNPDAGLLEVDWSDAKDGNRHAESMATELEQLDPSSAEERASARLTDATVRGLDTMARGVPPGMSDAGRRRSDAVIKAARGVAGNPRLSADELDAAARAFSAGEPTTKGASDFGANPGGMTDTESATPYDKPTRNAALGGTERGELGRIMSEVRAGDPRADALNPKEREKVASVTRALRAEKGDAPHGMGAFGEETPVDELDPSKRVILRNMKKPEPPKQGFWKRIFGK